MKRAIMKRAIMKKEIMKIIMEKRRHSQRITMKVQSGAATLITQKNMFGTTI